MLGILLLLEKLLKLCALAILETVVAITPLDPGQVLNMNLHFAISLFLEDNVAASFKASPIHF